MQRLSLIAVGLIGLAACGEREPAPTPVEQVTAAPVKTDAAQAVPVVMTVDKLTRICRAGLAAVHGQTIEAIEVDGVTGHVLTAAWRAPVDGGRSRAECRVEGDMIVWKPLARPNPAEVRWMNQSGDPVIRYTMDGDRITVVTTLPDGTKEQSELTVPVEQEAR